MRRKKSGRNTHQASLTLMRLEPRLVLAPNVFVPTTTSTAPLAFLAGSLNLSGPLAVSVVDTPSPASTAPFLVTVTSSAGTASVGSPANVTVAGDGTNSLQLQGSLGDINAALAGLVYTNATASATPATITVTAADGAATPLTDSKTIFVRASDPAVAPRITTALADATYFVESSLTTESAISFTVNDPQGASGITVTGTSDNTNLIQNANVTIGGSYPNYTVTLRHEANITGTALITLRAADAAGNFTTRTFKVTVIPTPTYNWAILAGSGGAGTTDGTGTSATFNSPDPVAVDSDGFVYVADTSGNKIRKINPTTRVVTTIAGSGTAGATNNSNPLLATFDGPQGLAVDSAGNVYVSETYLISAGNPSFRIRKIAFANGSYGPVTTLYNFNVVGNSAARGIALNSSETGLYVGFVNGVGLLNLSNNQFSFLAGSNTTSGTADGTGSAATFSNPQQIGLDLAGNVLLKDNNGNSTRQVTPAGVTTTLFSGLTAAGGQSGITQLRSGYYLRGNGSHQLQLVRSGDSVIIGGSGTAGETAGIGTAATFNNIQEIVEAPNGTIYFATSTGNRVRSGTPFPSLYNPGTQRTTEGGRLAFSNPAVAQLGAVSNAVDGNSQTLPITLTLAVANGTLDFGGVAAPAGVTVTFGAGNRSATIVGREADINPYLLNLGYTPDAGYVNASTTGGTPGTGAISPEVLSLSATTANNVATPVTGSLNIVVGAASNAPRIVTTLPAQTYYADPTLKVTEPAINFTIFDADTAATSFVNNATTGARITVTSDNPNVLLAADMATAIGGTGTARTLTLKHAAGITGVANVTVTINDGTSSATYTFQVTVLPASPTAPYWGTLAGRNSSTTGSVGFTDGTGTSASFSNPNGLVADAAGNLYVHDRNLIRRISPTGVVTTLAGSTTNTTRIDGVGAAAGIQADFYNKRMAVSPDGSTLYFISGGFLRKLDINPASPTFRQVTTLSGGGATATNNVNGNLSVATFPFSTTAIVNGGLAISADGSKLYVAENGFDGLRVVDLAAGTVAKMSIDGSTASTINAVSIGQYTPGRIFFATASTGGTAAYTNGVFALDLATGTTTKLFTAAIGSYSSYSNYAYNPVRGFFGLFAQGQFMQVSTAGVTLSTQGGTSTGLGFTEGYTPTFYSSATGRMGLAVNADGNFYISGGWDAGGNQGTGNIRGVAPQPSIYNPGQQSTTEGTPLVFNDQALEKMGALANARPNGQVLPVTYTLSVGNGTLSFNGVALPAGLTLTGLGTRSITLTGEDAVMNAYLANLAYTPDAGYVNANAAGGNLADGARSPDSMSISASTGFGTATGTLGIIVRSANNNPRITTTLTDRKYYAESTVSTETAIPFTILDPDTAATAFVNNASTGARITATSDNPLLIASADMATAIGGSGASRTITIKHAAKFTGTANVTVTITDAQGNTSSAVFKVEVVPAPNYYWGILAGSATGLATGSTDAIGTAARFSTPTGMVRDSQGFLFVADQANNVIRRIDPVTAQVTTFAGTAGAGSFADGTGAAARFNRPIGLAIDSNDNLYVADSSNNRIRKITSAGVVTTLAGTGTAGANNGAAATATFNSPWGVTVSPTGVVYVGDNLNYLVRKIENGVVSTLAGTAGQGGSTDGVGSVVRFNQPGPITMTPSGMLLVRDIGIGNIRQINPATGEVTTPVVVNLPSLMSGVDVDPAGQVYAALATNTLSLMSSFDTIRLVGTGTAGTVVGLNTTAVIGDPRALVFSPDGTLYLTSSSQNNIRVGTPYPSLYLAPNQVTTQDTPLVFSNANTQKLGALANAFNSTGTAPLPLTYTLSAGNGTLGFGSAVIPNGLTVTGVGTSTVTLSGSETDINALMASFTYTPKAGYFNANTTGGALASGALPADVLTMSASTSRGSVSDSLAITVRAATTAPRFLYGPLDINLVSTTTALTAPVAITFIDPDQASTAFVNNATTGGRVTVTTDNPTLITGVTMTGSGASRVASITHAANLTGTANVTITLNDGTNAPVSRTFKVTVRPAIKDFYFDVFVGEPNLPGVAGYVDATGTNARMGSPAALTPDAQGNIYFIDGDFGGGSVIRKVTQQGVVTTVAGDPTSNGFADGTGTAAKFNFGTAPNGGPRDEQMTIDSQGNLYVYDNGNARIRKVTPAGVVTTLAMPNIPSVTSVNRYQNLVISPDDRFLYYNNEGTGSAVNVYRQDLLTGEILAIFTLASPPSGASGAINMLADGRVSFNNGTNYIVVNPDGSNPATLFSSSVLSVTVDPVYIDPIGQMFVAKKMYTQGGTLLMTYDGSTAAKGYAVASPRVRTGEISGITSVNGAYYLSDTTRNVIFKATPAPELYNPGAQVVGDTQLLTLGPAKKVAVETFSGGVANVTLTLAVTKGTLTLSQLTGLTFTTGDGAADATMTFSGTEADVNAALNNLVYDFDQAANPTTTSDTLTVSVVAGADVVAGGILRSGTVPITIVKAPVITAIADVTTQLGTTPAGRAFTVTDQDTAANQVTVTVASSNTSLLPTSGITLTPGTGAAGTTAPANANYSLAFAPTAGRTGVSIVTITATDSSGASTTTTFAVTVAATVGAPDLVPASDTGSSSTDNITGDTTPTFSVSLSAGFQAGDVVAIYNGNTKIGEAVVTAADILAGAVLITTSPLADGSYSSITASVMFGTTRGVPSAALAPQLVIDTAAPTASGLPDLQPASDTGASSTDNVTNVTTPTFTIPLAGSGAVAGDTVELYNGTTLLGTYTLTAGDITANAAALTTGTLAAGTYSDVKFRLVDAAGNASGYSGSLSPALVIDTTAPLLTTLGPADNAAGILPPAMLVMTFNEAMAKGATGTITIKKASDDSTVESFNVATSGRVAVSGNKVTLTPATTLAYGTGYYVLVDGTALTDLAANAFAGLSQATDWNFTTLAAPTGVDLVTASDTGASSTDNVTNLANISLDVGLGAGTAVGDVIKLYDGLAVVGSITVDATMLAAGKVTFTLTGQGEGVHHYSSTLTAAAGETPATPALAVTIDTSAPSAPTLALDPASDTGIAGDGKTKDNTPTLNGTAEPNASVNLFIDGSPTPVTVVADASGKWTYTPTTPLADGPHSVVATQADVAGNTSGNSTPLLFTIDSTPPVPTAFSPADDSTNISPPTAISITFDEPIVRGSFGSITIWDDTTNTSVVIPASSSQLSFSGNVLTITPTTPFVSNTSYHVEIGLGVIRDGQANLFAGISNATDWNFTTNNAPASPAIDLQAASDAGFSSTDNKTNLTTLAFDIAVPAGAVAGDVVKVYDGQTLVSTITLSGADVTAGSVVATLTGVTAGSHSYTTTLTRTSDGLVSNASPALVVTVDTTPPAAPTIDPLGPTSDNTPTMSGTAPAGSRVDLYDANNNLIGSADADANGNWSFTPSAPLPDGNYQLSAKATDESGNTSPASAPESLSVDTTPPAKPVITAIGPDTGASPTDGITTASVLTLVGTAEPNSQVTVYDNGVVLGTVTTNGSGQWTFTTIPLNDGSNRFTVDATDVVGNRSVTSDPATMVIDSSAPSAPVINPLPSPNGDSTPILSGKGEPGSTVTVYDGGNPIGSAVVDANGDWTFTPSSPLSDGPHNFTADQKDVAGNSSPLSNQVNAAIDTAPPAKPTITPPAGPTNDVTPTINGTAEPNSTVKIYEGTTLLGTVVADGSGNWSFTPAPPLADGRHDLSATATDAAGNVSPMSDKVALVVDTVAPVETLLAPANGTSDASVHANLVVTLSEVVVLGTSGVIELRLADGTLVESFGVASSRLTLSGSTLTIDPTANLAFATGYYVTIAPGMLEDKAGNAYAGLSTSTDWAFTTDALPIPPAPAGLDLQPGSDTGRSNADEITSDTTPTLDIALNTSGLFAGDIVHLYADGVEVGTATLTADDIAAGKVSITTSPLADGVHSLTAKVSDANGTFSSPSAPLSVTIDTTPPVAPGVPDLAPVSDTGVSSTDDVTSINTPTFTGTGTPGDTISLFVDGVLAGTGVVDANGNYTITASTPIADGVHAITSQATDPAGLTGPLSAALSVTIDNTPPATPTSPADLTSGSDTGLSSTDNITSDTTPDFSGGGLTPGDTVVLYVDGSPAGTATVDANGNWTVNASPALIDGSHTVTYLVKDPAGNSSGFAPPMTVVVDTAVPAKPTPLALDPASDTGLSPTDRVTKDNTPTINGSGGTPGFQVTLLDGSSNVIGTAIVGPDGTWSITPATPLADGTYAFTAEYTSISGVTGPASDPLSVVIDTVAPSAPAAPTISPINPSATPGHTNSTSPVFTGSGQTPGSLVELFADGSTTPVGTAIVDAFGNYQVISATLADGPHTFSVKVTDAAGNTSPASQPTSLVIDSRLPGSPTTPDLTAATDTGRSATDDITSDNTPDFQGVVDATSNALPGDFVEIYSGNTLVGVGTVVLDALSGDLVWKVTVGSVPNGYSQSLGATVLTDGVQAISAAFRTPGGTLSAPSQALTVTVDTSAPSAPSAAPDLIAASDTGTSSTDNLTNDTTPSFSGSGGQPGDTVNLYANGNLIGSAVVGPDGSYTVTPTNPLADGTYNFTTNYVDAAGSTSPFSAPLNNVVIDSTPPAVPPVPDLVASSDTGASSTDNLTSDNTPTFEGFGTPGDTIRIYVDGVLAGTTTVDANGSWSLTTNSIADGVHSVTAQAVDPAGNASTQSTPLALTIDTTPPNAPVFITPSGPTDNSQPPISGTGEPGSAIRLYDGPSLIGTAIVNADGSWTITPSAPLAEGSHTFTATATDGAGNTSPVSNPINVTIDTVDPLAPAVISVSQDTGHPSDRITSDNRLTITGTAEPGSTVNVYDGTNVVGTAVVGPDGRYSVTTNVLPDGTYPLSIRAVDAAGNESAPTSIGTWTIDTGAPAPPVVGSVSQDTGNPTDKNTSDNTLTITGGPGSAEPGATITVYDSSSGTPVAVGTATVQPDGSYSVTTSVLADGQYPLSITAKDAAGNESQPTSIGTWTIDTGAPAAPVVGSVSQDTGNPTDKNTSDNTLTITGGPGSAEPGATITVYDSSSGTLVAVGTATVQPDGSYSATTSVLADGQYPLSITATDAAGNESAPTSIGTWTIDTGAPAAPTVGSVSQDTGNPTDKNTSDNTLTITGGPGSAEPGATITVYDSSSGTPVAVGTATVQPDGSYSVTTSVLADGQYPLSITATDAAGNESQPTSIGTWTIDTGAPAAPTVGSVSQDTGNPTDKNTSDNTLTITGGPGSAEPGATITVYDSSSGTPVAVGTATVQPDGSYSVTTSVLADGQYPLSITATDAADNESQPTSIGTWTIDTGAPAAPVVGSVSQDTGNPTDKNTSDNTLTITGGPGSAEPGATITVYDSSSGTPVAVGTATVQPDGSYTVTTSVLADGQYPLSITATDAAGNESAPTSIGTWTIDTQAPAAPTVGSVSQDTGNPTDKNTSDNTLTITGGPGSAEPGATITVYDSSSGTPVAVGTATVQPDGSYSVTTSVLSDGQHPLSITAKDAAGNESQPTSIGTWTIDTGAPSAPTVGSVSQDTDIPGDRITSDRTLTVTGGPGSAEPGATITVYDSSSGTPVAVGTATVQPDGSYSVTTSVLADGQYPLSVAVKDVAGNESQPTSIGTWTIVGFPMMAISGVTVNEATQVAIVRVSLSQAATAAIQFTPVVSSIPSTGGSSPGTVGSDVSGMIEYYNGTAWVSAAGGVTIPSGATGVLLRVAVINDVLDEGNEAVTIGTGPVTNVLNPAGVSGTITINDRAAGDLFSGSNTSGTPDAPGTNGLPLQLDDDRTIAVSNGGAVNEKSPFSIFRVSGVVGQLVSLTLTSNSATLGVDFTNSLEYFDGSMWVSYVPGSFVAIPAAPVSPMIFTAARTSPRSAAASPVAAPSLLSTPTAQSLPGALLVRVPVVQDTVYENSENFTLQAATTGNVTAAATGTILDNGTGEIFLPSNTSGVPDSPSAPGYPASLDDDMPLVVTATEADCGPGAIVMVMNPFTGAVRSQFRVFEPRFRGGARVALADVDGDQANEIVVASGPGRVGEFRVFEIDGTELVGYRTRPFGGKYLGGLEIDAGDVDGDGDADIVAVAAMGPGGRTAVFRVSPAAADPVENRPFKDFMAFGRKVNAGGSVAVADLNGDGRAEIIRGTGPGVRPLVNVFDVSGTPRIVDSFAPLAGLRNYTGGVSVSTTWFNGDVTPDILVAGGRGAGSVVEVYDGTVNARVANARLDMARLAAFSDLASRNAAVFAAAVDTDGDGVADRILSTQSEGGVGSGVRVLRRDGTVAATFSALPRSLRIAAARLRQPT